MTSIRRDPDASADQHYDLIIVGGGVYGCCLLLESARRGKKALLLERGDYGGATSWNSLRIIHGGLRYLQSADFPRFRRSVTEQAWWLKTFPDLVRPLPCLMPLYNQGLRRKHVMRCALGLNDYLAAGMRRASGLEDGILPPGQVISIEETTDRFPQVDPPGLAGAAIWHDARMIAPPRLLIELLRWASACDGQSINYMESQGLVEDRGEAVGVRAACQVTGKQYEFMGDHIVHCVGPWTSDCVQRSKLDLRPDDGLALAFNVVVDRAPLSQYALAVTPRIPAAQTYFMVPCGSQTLIGTAHRPYKGTHIPSREQVSEFLQALNSAIAGFRLTFADVSEVLSGRLPARRPGSHLPSTSPRIYHHRSSQGRCAVTSVVGVKLTTARHVAEASLRRICRLHGEHLAPYQQSPRPSPLDRSALLFQPPMEEPGPNRPAHDLRIWMTDESVVHVDDLLLRRCDPIGVSSDERMRLAAQVMTQIGWDAKRQQLEQARLRPFSDVDS